MQIDANPFTAIVLIGIVVYATRVMGPAMMLGVQVSAKIKRFLDGLALSVIVAIVASALATSTTREMVAVTVAAAVMFASRSAISAMTAGAMVAAAWSLMKLSH